MTSSKLLFEAGVRSALLARARDGAPDEVCGILIGTRGTAGGDSGRDDVATDARAVATDDSPVATADSSVATDTSSVVTDAQAVTNVAADPQVRYELDPAETLAIVEATEDAGDDVVGFYHSHPSSPARPSATDRAQATWTGYVYCIVSPVEDVVRAWRWTDEAFEPLSIEIRD